jgi:hypothetical protein
MKKKPGFGSMGDFGTTTPDGRRIHGIIESGQQRCEHIIEEAWPEFGLPALTYEAARRSEWEDEEERGVHCPHPEGCRCGNCSCIKCHCSHPRGCRCGKCWCDECVHPDACTCRVCFDERKGAFVQVPRVTKMERDSWVSKYVAEDLAAEGLIRAVSPSASAVDAMTSSSTGGKGRPMSAQEVEAAVRMHAAGVGTRGIAKSLGRSRNTVIKALALSGSAPAPTERVEPETTRPNTSTGDGEGGDAPEV